ncbi:c-type cytochrome [Winogradskyella tangerina]|uniref:c-type cytochrome n=1 Tax=Winogradskyella tangerina TaxID=2023240 RepID=UPI000DBE052C|nr:cytochrome c [Winogradskyella tangerina]
MKIRKLVSVFFVLSLLACSYDSEDDLIDISSDDTGIISDDPNDDPDPDGEVTYNDDIAPIMQSSCVSCHGSPPVNGAPFALVNYNQVSQRAEGVLNRMSLQNGAPGAMPPSGRLPQATIDLIAEWIDNGKPQN